MGLFYQREFAQPDHDRHGAKLNKSPIIVRWSGPDIFSSAFARADGNNQSRDSARSSFRDITNCNARQVCLE
jgi:hypothetical protein